MHRVVGISAVLLLVPVASAPAAEHTISVGNDFFNPPDVQIVVGDTVNWVFEEAGDHNVQSAGGQPESFDSDPGKPDSLISHPAGYRFSHTFNQDNVEVDYLCRVHPIQMNGTVTVGSPPADTTAPVIDPARPRVRRRAIRVGFELSEGALVRLRVAAKRRPRRSLRTAARRLEAGRHSIAIRRRGLRPRRYVARLTATDDAGNASPVVTASFRIRPRR